MFMVKLNVFICLFGECALLKWIVNVNQLFEEKDVSNTFTQVANLAILIF